MRNSLKQRWLKITGTLGTWTIGLWMIGLMLMPTAWASTPIKLTNPSYHACPPELAQGTVTTRNSQPARCFIVTATAQNDSGKTAYDADVFGRIYDANGDTIFENRGRIGTVAEIPAGTSEISVRITVDPSQPEPLELKQFKATGFVGNIRKEQQIIPSTAE
ncbi:MAG: hypothetical protein RLZZ511_3722 [Cyanobacteriota bacterium]|jgi:hypothetical protein